MASTPVRTLVAALALATASSACVNLGRDFSSQSVSALEIGRTSQSDARRLFGDPGRTGVEDGDLTWTYYRYRYSLFSPERTKDLVLRFGPDRTLRSYTFNETGESSR